LRLTRALLIVLTCGLFVAGAASAQQAVGLTAAQLFELASSRREAGAVEDAITLYDALARDSDSEIRAEARYRKGLMLADLGRYAEAAVAFRALLDEKPNALAARLELARMLAALGREAEARRELRQARAVGIPPEAAQAVDRFAAALRSTKRFGGSAEVALTPDSNVNRATEARTLDTIIAPLTLSEDARARSGVGGRVAGQAFGKIPITDEVSFLTRISGVADIYRASEFDDVSVSALAGLEWRGLTDTISPSIGETRRWFGGEPYARTETVTLDWVKSVDRRSQLVLSGSASAAHYARNRLQDGEIYDLSIAYERALTGSTGASLAIGGTRQLAQDPGYSTWSGGLTVSAWRESRWGTLFFSSGIRRTEGDERLFLFAEPRREWLLTANAGVNLRALTIAGFAPSFRISLERNESTVGIYDYRRVAARVGIVRAF
jgi:tetratricopeptide (TPR) repeat protein